MEENAAANKDLHIQNLSRKMTRTKDGVSDVAEELLQSADEVCINIHLLFFFFFTVSLCPSFYPRCHEFKKDFFFQLQYEYWSKGFIVVLY